MITSPDGRAMTLYIGWVSVICAATEIDGDRTTFVSRNAQYHFQNTSLQNMATVKFEMAPEDRANAMAEAKARGLPSGWIVELDVSD